jgi:tRNA (adenine37-N6)-methyltransferase
MDSTVLLVMDVQESIVGRFDDASGYLRRLTDAITAARSAGVPVVYVTVGFRPGHPEVSPRNKTFAAIAGAGTFAEGDEAARIHPAITPQPGDVVVTKRRVSAFAGSDLEVLLRGLGAGTLVLAGIATSGVVLSTVRQAVDLDYRVVVLADACIDSDPEVHRVLTEKVFPRQADVRAVADWAADLPGPRPDAVVVRPIARVLSPRTELTDDHWGDVASIIRLDPSFGAESVAGLADFSHLEVVYQFDQVPADEIAAGARHPRNNPDWPLVGIFAQRGKNRPNRLGVSRCSLVRVDGTDLHVLGLDAVDATPVLDIKPYLREFGPRGEVRQPAWAGELMREYY